LSGRDEERGDIVRDQTNKVEKPRFIYIYNQMNSPFHTGKKVKMAVEKLKPSFH